MRCPHVGRCGGCTYYDIPYAEELREKEQTLRTTLGAYGSLLKKVHPAPQTEGYRNKMELAFGDTGKPPTPEKGDGDTSKPPTPEKGDGNTGNSPQNEMVPLTLALGIRKKRSLYEIATTEQCILMPDDFKLIAAYTLQFFRNTNEAVYHRKKQTGTLRHLVLRCGHFTGEILVLLSTTSGLTTDLMPFIDGLRNLPIRGTVVGILHAKNDGVADVIKNEHIEILWGRDFYHEKLYADTPRELTFRVSAFSFFQTNSAGAESLYDIVRAYATDGCKGPIRLDGTALDLYCGTGTIAQILAPAFTHITGIELITEAIEAARTNAHLNNITNCTFHATDITKATQNDMTSYHLPSPPAVIVVDPPRDGLPLKALHTITTLGADRIVYVACKAASLARDLPILAAAGYTPTRLTAVDLFPRTPHIETICLLERTS